MATWTDKLREWNYDLAPVASWLMDTVQYQAARHGPIAYLVTALTVILILLSFPPSRSLTKAFCAGVFKLVLNFIQLAGALLFVQAVGFIARLGLTLFHKARVWIVESARRARE